MNTNAPGAASRPIQVELSAADTPLRVAYVQSSLTAKVSRPRERMVMTFPHLIAREIIAFEVLTIVVALMSLLFNAPLEEMANPVKTPNPAKAPWYFLGLQELLHYYPPVVAGVLLPSMVVIALIVIPYVRMNLNQIPLSEVKPRTVRLATVAAILLSSILWLVDQNLVARLPIVRYAKNLFPEAVALDIYLPTVVIWLIPCALTLSKGRTRLTAFLLSRGLPFWIMTWFVALATTLTVIGTFFRGQGWAFVMPWEIGRG